MSSFSEDDLIDCMPALQRFASSLTREIAAADDLVQETVERALTRTHLFQPGTNLRAWLFTICRNRFLSERRKRHNVMVHVPLDDCAVNLKVAANQDQCLEMRDLSRGLESLSETDRQVIDDVVFSGLSYEQSARRMGVEIGTVKSRLSRARVRLQTAMEYGATPRLAA